MAGGSDFGPDGLLKSKKGERVHLDRAAAEALVAGLADTSYDVRSVESKPYRRSPYAPFRTTTLQQEASRKLGMSASVTMSVAQRLYENGFITYMRTDSTTLSGGAVGAARARCASSTAPSTCPTRRAPTPARSRTPRRRTRRSGPPARPSARRRRPA